MKKSGFSKRIKDLTAVLLTLAMLFACCGCEEEITDTYVDTASDTYVDGGMVLCLSPSLEITASSIAETTNVMPETLYFISTTSVGVNLLLDGTGDSMITLRPTSDFYANRSEYLSTLLSDSAVDLRMLVAAGKDDLKTSLNSAIASLQASGKLDELQATWITPYITEGRPENAEIQPEMPSYIDAETTIRVGFSGCLPPIDYILGDGTPGGYTLAFWAAVAEMLHANIEFVRVLPESKVSFFLNEKIDVFFWHFIDVPEYCVTTDPFMTCNLAFLQVDLPEETEESAE